MEDVKVTSIWMEVITMWTPQRWHLNLLVLMAIRRRPAKKGKPRYPEPMMKVEVEVPEEFMGEVIGEISKRRGQVTGMGDRGGNKNC